MKSTIRLFKAVVLKSKRESKDARGFLAETLPKGFIFAPEVIYNSTEAELLDMIKIIEKEYGLTAEQMNSSFHKSWQKVKTAKIEQLVLEQLIHYFTTYGFQALGIYDKDSVYIPNEKLEIPELEEGINLTIIKGYTKAEFKEKVLALLQSGIALSEDTINDVIDVATFAGITEEEIGTVKNKEVKVALYSYFDLFPANSTEFLRYVIYIATGGKTLLIKDKVTIAAIKAVNTMNITGLFRKYGKKHGFERLAEIFYRFKSIFLAFKTNALMKKYINRIRKLAKKYHKPMLEDYLNEVTAKLKSGEGLTEKTLIIKLGKVNIWRKIRLAYALQYRTKNVNSILYRVRNGKGYAKEFKFNNKHGAKEVLNVVLNSIAKDMEPNIEGKKIYIPEYITYTLPATEKQFTGDFPTGTCITIPRDMVVGIHWENVNPNIIDLDLSMINSEGKIGWDSAYRTAARTILFSGDVVSPERNGASELFYVKRQSMNSYILFVNYYNYDTDVEVPMKILVAKEQVKSFRKNYMVKPNNILSVAKTKITQKQKILGLLIMTTKENRFYFTETYLGGSITASNSKFVEHSRNYLFDFYRNTISLNNMIKKAGGEVVRDKEICDIDLSPENLEKDKIINLLTKNKEK